MNISRNVSLKSFSTMRLGGTAAVVIEAHSSNEIIETVRQAKKTGLAVIMVGGGSNIIWRDGLFKGVVIVNRLTGYQLVSQDEDLAYVRIGAGENWDSVVERTVAAGLSGIECLSLIPGTAGATPIQNVGAYGQEISQTLVTLTVYDSQEDRVRTLTGTDCGFSYRKSRFNSQDKGRYFILDITLMLQKKAPLPPFYPAVANYLESKQLTSYSPAVLRQAVIAIRSAKLPNPATTANCGSFFGNPVVNEELFNRLHSIYESMPYWDHPDGFKLSAAWLIEQAGFANYQDKQTGISTWPNQPLVLINEAAKSTADLLSFRDTVIAAVKQKFGVSLNQEPELLP